MVDIEFLVQMLQLKHGGEDRTVRLPNTLSALSALHRGGYLADGDFEFFSSTYRFLRTIEAKLRLMNATARDDLPDDPVELAKLARQLGYAESQSLLADCERVSLETRARFDRLFDAAAE
jgi:glutamate-ammonia-ligase adenylyltransferase